MSIVVIEGTDGCGKETQSRLLVERLGKQNIKAFRQSFPNYGSAGAKPVETLLSGNLGTNVDALDEYQTSVLFAVDRLFTYKTVLKEHLDKGDVLVLDRYVESNLLYQATRILDSTKFEEYVNWLLNFEYSTLKLPKPDLVIYLNMPPNISKHLIQSRGKKNDLKTDIYENDDIYMQNVYERGLKIAQKFDFTIIDCVDKNGKLKTIQDINNEICSKVCNKILAHTKNL